MNRLLLALSATLIMVSCQKELSFEVGTPASGSLQNSAGECNPKNVAGNFIAGTALTDSNFLEVTIDVTVPGTYNISTDTVNGYYFRGQGSFANAGVATVKLNAAGTPLSAGVNDFFVIFDSSFCSVSVTVLPAGSTPPPTGSQVYFPMTANSWWSYDQGGTDTIKVSVGGTKTLASNTYRNFITADEFGNSDTSFYRYNASNNSYYQYIDASAVSGLQITFSQPFLDILFMKENLASNATWNSDHNGTAGGFPVTLRFKFNVLNNNASITVNGKNYTNVYRIQMTPQLGTAGVFSDMATPSELFYAKGIGLVKFTDGTDSENIRFYQVN
ncbi:MAG: hypothetical protein H0U44_03205 [Flavisolibacter sp.]|nr:hypothetical protein [Flavisolibacter sp.]